MNSLLARLLVIVAVAVIPALAFQAYTESQVRQARQHLVADEARRLASRVGAEQQRIIEGADQMLTVLGAAPCVRGSDAGLCQRFLADLGLSMPRFDGIAVIGSDGHPLAASVPYDSHADVADRAWFRQALATGTSVVGDYGSGIFAARPTLPIARRFTRPDGSVAGVIIAEFNLTWMERQLQAIPVPAEAAITIADRNGIILARRPDQGRFIGKPIPPGNTFVLQATRPEMTSQAGIDGRTLIVAFIPPVLDPRGLYVSAGLDLESTLAPVTEANRIGVLLILAGAVIALGLTALLGGYLIRRPFHQLLHAADQWRSGNLSARVGLRHDGSECGRLVAAFEAMADALQARDRALWGALESTSDAVITLDPDGRITYLNPHARAQTGLDGDVLGKVIWTVLPREDGRFAAACQAAMERGEPMRVIGYSTPMDKHWDVHVYPSGDGLTLFARDVTQERRTMVALQASEERLRLAISAGRFGVRDYDLVAGKAVWTAGAETIFGADHVGRTTFDSAIETVHPDDRARVRANWQRVLSVPGDDYELEYRIRQADGSWRWACTYGRVIFEAGCPVRAIAVVQDIDARKRIEADLHQATTLLRAISDSSADAVFAKDTEGRYIYVNPALLELMGRTADAALGRTIAELHANPEQAAAIAALDQQVIRTGRTAVMEEVYDTAEAGTHIFRTAKSPLRSADGTVIGIVGISSDITALKNAETELRNLSAGLELRVQQEIAAREAAQARATQAERLQALGQLAAGIAHDFNNVLQAVSGAMALIERRPDDHVAIRRLARLAGEATERGATITRRLLAFGRRSDLHAEAIDTGALLADLQDILAHTLGAGIIVRTDAETDVPGCTADRGQLETSLINLATNARDAMPQGGLLVLSASSECVTAGHPAGIGPGRYIRFQVTDSGSGMDAATLAHATEPFFTTKAPGVGTGLGLSMVKGFAEQSGGGLSLMSAPGQGTTVTLWLPEAAVEPAHRDRAAAQGPDKPPHADGGTPAAQVLLVDDEAPVREVLAMQLEDAGFAVLSAASGRQALERLDGMDRVDVLVTDLSMPGMDGLAVIHAVHERCPGLPALLLTGYAGDSGTLARRVASDGTFILLRKPIQAANLVEHLRTLLAAEEPGAMPRQAAS
ncbi:PAS domain-containing protein [Rhodopila globiformis]|nr:PAS domain-containing protein [Rhodopila globiformis]